MKKRHLLVLLVLAVSLAFTGALSAADNNPATGGSCS